jgi:hypothetical protein
MSTAEQIPTARPRVNAHVHLPPNFTAFETTAQALALAEAQGVRVLGASNYYDYHVYTEFAAQAARHGVFPLFGLEVISLIDDLVKAGVRINDPGNAGKMYLCGKGITQFSPMGEEAQGLLRTIQDSDSTRMAAVAERLDTLFADVGVETELDAEAIKQRVAVRHGCDPTTVYLQERHLAQAFQEVFFSTVPADDRGTVLARLFGVPSKSDADDAVGLQNEIRSQLMKAGKVAFVPDTFVDFDHARRLVLALGGLPCYPVLADGVSPLTEYEASPEALVADLTSRGIVCAEFIPLRNSAPTLSRYVYALRDAGLFVTAGTEHNTLELLPLTPTCLHDEPIPDDLDAIFWEGACVVAAHQSLTQQGEPGYVDADGTPNPAYPSAEERIQAFARLGAEVIAHS